MMRLIPRRAKDLNIIEHKYVWISVSITLIVVSIVGLFILGLNFGIDFTGGTEFNLRVKPKTNISVVRAATGSVGYASAQIQSSGNNQFLVRVPKLDDAKTAQLTEALKKSGNMEELLAENSVGPGWGGQVTRQAIVALIAFLVAILIYISVRFEFKMAISAIIAVLHDLVVTVGVYALTEKQVTPATVIAVLTILGYSLYDTIVIFDRIKENSDLLTRQSKKTYSLVVNESINQVMARSINTSLTTLMPVVTILFFGGETLKAFAFPLFIGIAAGTYSSIFVASPFLALWKETEPKYRAYISQVERRNIRDARESGDASAVTPVLKKSAGARASSASAGARKTVTGARDKRPPPSKPQPKPMPKTSTGESGESTHASKPVPKPKPAQGGQTSKNLAKSRTKGPGSGKKKKKK
ncbi:MAG: protein translocase subunit SecF [Candidatus Anoxymicrobium japonicum]|uniref:Protein-export membrane protein SecF n=1 Tax=Candidatus Anoxymicrobium japonicum TaxID=2013648 RepID=A0A2N3G802_9ACTN|nr:MAG: protein translocase subunit SecF [Candidatus Anoxymicrobium japonicum]